MLQCGPASNFRCEPVAGERDAFRLDRIHGIVVSRQVPEANRTEEEDDGREGEKGKAQPEFY